MLKTTKHTFTVRVEEEKEGGFSSWVEEIPGANSQGETEAEAVMMALDALVDLMFFRADKERDRLLREKNQGA